MENHQVRDHQGCGGDTPFRHANPILALQIPLPMHLAGSRIETVQMSGRAQRECPPLVDGDARARSRRVTDPRIIAGVRMHPQLLPALFVETHHTLDFVRIGLAVHHVHAPVGHRGTTVPGADRGGPFPGQLRRGKGLE